MANLQANLEHISKDRTRDIITSVVQIKIASDEKGCRKGMSDAKVAVDAYLAQCLHQLKHHLEHNGVDVATLQLDSFLSGTTSGSLLASSHAGHAPNPNDPSTFSYCPHKHCETEVRKGKKTIEGLSASALSSLPLRSCNSLRSITMTITVTTRTMPTSG